jgi:alkyldihydroxyacetonephosphate synthase
MSAAIAMLDERMAAAVGAPNVSVADKRLAVKPGSAQEIADVLRIAREVSATAGVGAKSGVAIDLSRLRNVLHLDETSLTCAVQAGLSAGELEEILAPRGLTLGLLPHWSRKRTIGALLAAPRPSEASPRLGRFTAQCASIGGLLSDGTSFETRLAPRKATGPDLMHALIGARGTLGILLSATLRVHRRGEAREDAAWKFASVENALLSARTLLTRGARPVELAVAGTTLSLISEGSAPQVAAERALVEEIAHAREGAAIPHAPLPLITRAPHERAVALRAIEAALPPAAGRVVGWNLLGATVIDPDRAAEPPDPPGAFYDAFKRRLDESKTLPAWPGA